MTVFLSAFLLFQVQLLIGKAILPWFGGTAAVWMTCLLFFQVLLLCGYLYAYLLVNRLPPRWQGLAHLAPLLLSLLLLPIAPSETWKPSGAADPTWRILALLTVTVGGPFLVLSATGPLIQAWSARLHPGRSPYRLYALSNAGSLLGLLSYPFLVEPSLRLPVQMSAWSIGHAVFVLLCIGWAVRMTRAQPAQLPVVATSNHAAFEASDRPDAVTRTIWLLLAACGSAILLATTNQITQDVTPVPFLWVLPLSLYLLSFILCFDRRRWYRRQVVGWVLAASLFIVAFAYLGRMSIGLGPQVAAYALVLLACCMACHGELAALKPAPRHLTAFYLIVAAGGAVGGALVTLVAPAVFKTLVEYPLALFACCAAWSVARRRDVLREALRRRFVGRPARLAAAAAGGLLLASAAIPFSGLAWRGYLRSRSVLEVSRNFYGALQVGEEDRGDPSRHRRRLTHGSTVHGVQFQDPLLRTIPASYYGPGSGIEACLRAVRGARAQGLRIGVIGMGAGELAAYAGRGDALTFYEINPDVVRLARRWFTYWDDAVERGARLDVEMGDARLVLERELKGGTVEPCDVLVVDAFTSDAIPVHLLTAECFALYRRKLAGDGLLAVHVSSLFLNLSPVVRQQAEGLGWGALCLSSPADADHARFENDWVAATPDASLLTEIQPGLARIVPWPPSAPGRPWTDDFSSLLPLLK
jgi:hypothetical protein